MKKALFVETHVSPDGEIMGQWINAEHITRIETYVTHDKRRATAIHLLSSGPGANIVRTDRHDAIDILDRLRLLVNAEGVALPVSRGI